MKPMVNSRIGRVKLSKNRKALVISIGPLKIKLNLYKNYNKPWGT